MFPGLDWQRCPVGTYSNQLNLSSVEECTTCDPRYYCNETAATSPTQLCFPGYYCKSGIAVPNPDPSVSGCEVGNDSPYPKIGDVCPTGSYCPEGSESPEVTKVFSVIIHELTRNYNCCVSLLQIAEIC